MDRTAVADLLRTSLLDVLDVDEALVTPDARLADTLGADSVHIIQVAGLLESELGIAFDDRELYDLQTVGEFVDLTASKLGG